jgi:O-antigen/teichoic acid export membrane protein
VLPTSKSKLLRNALYNSGSWLGNILVTMVATPYFVLKLSVEGYGVYALLTGLLGYYGLLDFGLGQGVTKYVAEFSAAHNDAAVNRSINAALSVQSVVGLIGSVLLILLTEQVLRLLNIPKSLLAASRIGLYVSACGFFFTMIAGTLNAALTGLQLFSITGKVSVVMNIVLTCAIALALALGGGILAAVVLTGISAVLLFGVYARLLRVHIPGFRFAFDFDRREFGTLGSFSGYIFLSKISNVFSQYIVRFVVSAFLGPAAVTLYVVPAKLVSAIGGLLVNGFSVLFPFASELQGRNDPGRARSLFENGSKYFVAIAAPMLLFIMIAARPLLSLWMGEEFARKGWMVLALLAFSGLLGSLTTVPNLVSMGLGYARVIGLFSLMTIVVYAVFLPLWTGPYGLLGTCWAMALATIPGLFLVLYETRILLQLDVGRYLRNALAFHVIPVAVALIYILSGWSAAVGSSVFGLLGSAAAAGVYIAILTARGYLPVMGWLKDITNGDELSGSVL